MQFHRPRAILRVTTQRWGALGIEAMARPPRKFSLYSRRAHQRAQRVQPLSMDAPRGPPASRDSSLRHDVAKAQLMVLCLEEKEKPFFRQGGRSLDSGIFYAIREYNLTLVCASDAS